MNSFDIIENRDRAKLTCLMFHVALTRIILIVLKEQVFSTDYGMNDCFAKKLARDFSPEIAFFHN